MGEHLLDSSIDGRLLQAVVEQMKLPLLQVARQAELGRLNGDAQTSLHSIEFTADTALRLLDSYLLSARLTAEPNRVDLEPVSVSAILSDIAHQLSRIAREEQCELSIHLSGRYEPVIAHRAALESALTSIGYTMIKARGAQPAINNKRIVTLAAHRISDGIVAGVYSDTVSLSNEIFKRGQKIYGISPQALPEFMAGSGADVYVANALLVSMSTRLRISHHQKLSGLAATLLPSHQLSLI